VVKIKMKAFALSLVIFLFLMSTAYAAGSKLIFSDVDVKVGGRTSNNLNNNDRIGEDVEPGDNIEFRIKVQNNFTSAENLKIRDVTVKTTIEGIDDGNDLEEESSNFDLSPGSDKRITLKFQSPIEVSEDTFDVLIHAEGEDKNGTNHESEMKLKLEVNKKSHMLKITRKTLSPAEVSCNRKNVQLAVTAINIGTEDEKDVAVEVSNPDLGISAKDRITELIAEPNEPESRFSKTYSFAVPGDAEAGSYPIAIMASYDDDRKRAEDTAQLTVSECAAAKKEASAKPKEVAPKSTDSEEVTVISPTTGRTTAAVVQPVQPAAPEGITVSQESIFSSNAFVAGIIIAEVVAVIVGIVLIAGLFRRKG